MGLLNFFSVCYLCTTDAPITVGGIMADGGEGRSLRPPRYKIVLGHGGRVHFDDLSYDGTY